MPHRRLGILTTHGLFPENFLFAYIAAEQACSLAWFEQWLASTVQIMPRQPFQQDGDPGYSTKACSGWSDLLVQQYHASKVLGQESHNERGGPLSRLWETGCRISWVADLTQQCFASVMSSNIAVVIVASDVAAGGEEEPKAPGPSGVGACWVTSPSKAAR